MKARAAGPRVLQISPSIYRCAETVPAPPFASRGGCNPDDKRLVGMVASAPTLPFSLETESAESLQARMTARTLTAKELTKAYLAREDQRGGPGHPGRP